MRKRFLACLSALVMALAAPALPTQAGTRTDIPSAAAASPKQFWRAVMEHFHGGYDRSRKCWIGTMEGARQCMRPHRLDTVSAGGVTRHYVVTGGYEITGEGGPVECHVCTGSLGLIVLQEAGKWLELVARDSLAEKAGSWGRIPPEDSFRLREIGDGRHGWTMETGWMGQGYVLGSVIVYGVSGSDVIQLGHIPVHADNSGACGEGMDRCFEHSYELVFAPVPGAAYYDIVLRKISSEPGDPEGFRVPFDEEALKYQLPEEAGSLFNY